MLQIPVECIVLGSQSDHFPQRESPAKGLHLMKQLIIAVYLVTLGTVNRRRCSSLKKYLTISGEIP